MISWIIEAMRRAERRAAKAEAEAEAEADIAAERTLAVDALRESEERLRLALQATATGTFEYDLQTGEGRWNDAEFELLGVKPNDIASSPEAFFGYIHPEDREAIGAAWLDGLRTGAFDAEFRIIRSDGEERWLAGKAQFAFKGGIGEEPLRFFGINYDITERKRAEESLKRERDLLQNVMDGARNTHLAYLDRDFYFVRVNKTYATACGYQPEEMIGKNHFALYPHPENEAIFARARDTGESFEIHDKPFEFPDDPGRGVTYWDWTLSPVKDSEGDVQGLVLSLHETTERKRAEEAAQTRADQLREAQRIAHVGNWTWDAQTDVTTGSDELLRIYGFDPAKQTMPNFADQKGLCYPSDEWERLNAAVQKSVRTGAGYELDIRAIRKEESIWITTRCEAETDADGQVTGLRGTVQDITERKASEAALQESEALYRAIGESIDYGIWICDAEGRNTYASESFLTMVGITQKQCSEFGWSDLLHPDDAERTIKAWTECVKGSGPWYREHRFRGADGQWHPVLACGVPVRNDRGEITAWAGINLDISRMKQTEERLRQTANELARSNKDLEHFAYIAAHDLQEPLRTVRAFAQLLAKRYHGSLDATAQEYLRYVVDGAGRMSDLVSGLLDYSRVSSAARAMKPTDCGHVLRQALDSLQLSIRSSRAQVTHDPLPAIAGDERQLTQLFQNLIGNAIKFRSPDVEPRIHVGVAQQDGFWRFSVRDNGIGIEPQHQGKVFEIFRRLHGPQEYPGTGIGLAVCKRIVERHFGRIWIESASGEGTTLHFTLPILEMDGDGR